MGAKKDLKLFIGIDLCGVPHRNLSSSLKPFLEEFRKLPLTWILSSSPLLEKRDPQTDKIITEIKTRIGSLGDAVIPSGYAGAAHPLLTVKEIEKELEWSLKNPWGSGILNVFKVNPDMLVPFRADLLRNEVINLYLRAGFRALGLPGDGTNPYRFWGPVLKGNLAIYYFHKLAEKPNGKVSRYVSDAFPGGQTCIFLSVSADESSSLPLLLSVLKELEKRFTVTVTTPNGTDFSPQPPPGNLQPGLDGYGGKIENTPRMRVGLEEASRIRSADKVTNERIREILRSTACFGKTRREIPDAFSRDAKSAAEHSLMANMPGEVLLPGSGITIRFSSGQLSGLQFDQISLLSHTAVEAFLTAGETRHRLVCDRVFSFEQEDMRGLESSLSFAGGKERVQVGILRYAVSGDLSWLFISGEFFFKPSFWNESIREIVPLGIPLVAFDRDKTVTFHSRYHDGSVSSANFSGVEHRAVLTGTVFSCPLRGKHLVFGYLSHGDSLIAILELHIVKEKNKYIVFLNPFGTYMEDSAYKTCGSIEARSFYLGVRDEAPVRPPVFPNSVLKNIPRSQAARFR